MTAPDWIGGLGGGALIGLAAVLLLALNGRVAGVSGILGGVLAGATDWRWRCAFLAGLPLGAALCGLVTDGLAVQLQASSPVMAVSGLLVGFGTRLGSGCTSGHGICGLARLSPRSAVATATFLVLGMVTASVLRKLVW